MTIASVLPSALRARPAASAAVGPPMAANRSFERPIGVACSGRRRRRRAVWWGRCRAEGNERRQWREAGVGGAEIAVGRKDVDTVVNAGGCVKTAACRVPHQAVVGVGQREGLFQDGGAAADVVKKNPFRIRRGDAGWLGGDGIEHRVGDFLFLFGIELRIEAAGEHQQRGAVRAFRRGDGTVGVGGAVGAQMSRQALEIGAGGRERRNGEARGDLRGDGWRLAGGGERHRRDSNDQELAHGRPSGTSPRRTYVGSVPLSASVPRASQGRPGRFCVAMAKLAAGVRGGRSMARGSDTGRARIRSRE